MMRWGRKKPSSSQPSLTSRALPIPWLSKFNVKNIVGSESKPAKEKQNEKGHNMSASSSSTCARRERGRFYSNKDGDSWRLLLDEESTVMRSERHESFGGFDFPPRSCRGCGSYDMGLMVVEQGEAFREMIKDLKKKRRVFRRDTDILPDKKAHERENRTVIMTPRTSIQKDKKLQRSDQRILEEKWQKLERHVKDTEVRARRSEDRTTSKIDLGGIKAGFGSRKHTCASSMNIGNYNQEMLDLHSLFSAQNLEGNYLPSLEKLTFQWQKLKEMKIKEAKSKAEQQRKSMYISRGVSGTRTKQNRKVRVLSPRASSRVERCGVKALEDMKKAKLKMKAHEEKVMKGFESFAVVKCSLDPQNDFRDSMIEMIMENGINQPEELKELLVCYLTLNSDEYHDLIINVFKQVWFDLKR